ncbi:ABC transporter substrate-binding protein [Marinigracilibium pacificum]|uniref:ABC transporter substrate-binding protein n=1 Tax=Marinigracilibium pacificum TaxID=2729599 RepID=A0A848J8X5_9BACT|nr:ABC transporter substrate-binding protein [Marinigracilibium pacificum]NMM49502.1 ABC transporter substrate-binding protein [Marinigracilibium pacificum]
MKNPFTILTALFFLAIISISCKKTAKNEGSTDAGIIKNDYAKGFSIEKKEDGYLLKLFDTNNEKPLSEILLTNGSSAENNDIPSLSIPLDKVIIGSSTFIGFLDTLESLKIIKGFPGKQLIYDPELLEQINSGTTIDLGNQISWNVEKVAEINPDAMLLNLFGTEDPSIDNIRKLGVPVLYIQDFQEPHPLGKAEWIKVFGLLTGKYEEAISIFDGIKNDYLSLKSSLASIENKRGVTSGMVYEDAWFAPGGDSYMATLIADAGGKYIWEDKSGTGGLPLAKEVILTRAKDAEYWIGAAAFSNYEKLKDHDKLFESIKAVKDKNVYTYIGKVRENGGNDYFERGPVEPHIILKDMVKIMYPEMAEKHKLVYYKALQ